MEQELVNKVNTLQKFIIGMVISIVMVLQLVKDTMFINQLLVYHMVTLIIW